MEISLTGSQLIICASDEQTLGPEFGLRLRDPVGQDIFLRPRKQKT